MGFHQVFDHHINDERPDEVELLFNGQRPGMQEYLGLGCCVKIVTVKVKIEIRNRQECCDPAVRHLDKPFGAISKVPDHEAEDHDYQQGWKQSPDPAGIKIGSTETAALCVLFEDTRDEEPTDHEEDIDTKETTFDVRQVKMKQKD